ncbi:MAG: (2Fe-2S) ferredoxin domain-containing protein [Cyanobacteria bacterium P01_H01_bin.35]
MVENNQVDRLLLVCQNRSCLKQSSAKLLAAFQTFNIPNIAVKKSVCLGKCGSGAMVLDFPEERYICVDSKNISVIVERHLLS